MIPFIEPVLYTDPQAADICSRCPEEPCRCGGECPRGEDRL